MSDKIFFPNLDGLRFLAFFLVFWQHSSGMLFDNLKNASLVNDTHLRFFLTGGLGVSFFFVLSGFLITYLLLVEKSRNGQVNVPAFYVRRILRIFPLFYLVVVFGFGIYPLIRLLADLQYVDNGNFFLYALFLGNFDAIFSGTENAGFVGVLWSVSIEEQFYLVWALLFAYLPTSTLKFLFPAIIIASTGFRYFNADNEKILYFHTLSVVSDLAMGGGMAYLSITHAKFEKIFAELRRTTIVAIYILGFTLIWFYPSLFWLDSYVWLQRLFFALFFAFIIAEQNYSIRSLTKMKDFETISKLGTLTYGLYCLHMIALYFLELSFRYLGLDQALYSTNAVFMLLGFILSVCVASISYNLFESRFLRLKEHFAAK